jgi:hypothetical protein
MNFKLFIPMTKKISTQCVSVSHGVSIVCGEGAVKPKQTNNPPVGLAGIFFTNDVCNAHAYARTMALVSKNETIRIFSPRSGLKRASISVAHSLKEFPPAPKLR